MKNTFLLFVLATICSYALAGDDQVGNSQPGDGTTKYSDWEITDLKAVAEARGWTLDESKVFYTMTKRASRLAVQMAEDYGDSYLGTVLPDEPTGTPTIYLSDQARDVENVISSLGEDALVTQVRALGRNNGQVRSMARSARQKRQKFVHQKLANQGYDVESHVDITTGRIKVMVIDTNPHRHSTQANPRSIFDDGSDIDIMLTDQKIEAGAAYGGMRMTNAPGWAVCTSGWPVKNSSGTEGVTTAAHCGAMARIKHDYVTHNTSFQADHVGEYGDVQWHTTTEEIENKFYADTTDIRTIHTVQSVSGITVGQSICVYGLSGGRSCAGEVAATDVTVTVSGLGTLENMVKVSGYAISPGDSGGPWYYGALAIGTTSLYNTSNNLSWFTPADLMDEALDVSVMTWRDN